MTHDGLLKGYDAHRAALDETARRLEHELATHLQHAWAQVEHDLGYKAGAAVPDAIRRRFSRVWRARWACRAPASSTSSTTW